MRWAGGAWCFETRDINPGLHLSIPETVLGGLRDTSNEGVSPSEILSDVFLALTTRGERLLPLLRSVFGAHVPDVLPGGTTAKQLIEQGLPAALLDAMILTDAVVATVPSLGPALTLKTEDMSVERSPLLDSVAKIYQRHGRHRGLEQFYRRLLRGGCRTLHDQAALWQRLGMLYSDHLDDPAQANHAFAAAARLGAIAGPPRRSTPATPSKSDADFIAASLRIATGDDTDADRAQYDQLRPRTLPRARCTMTRELWNLLRHPTDETDIGALAELIAPAVHALHPVTLADLSVDPARCVPEHELPIPFAQLRAYTAELLGLPTVPVYAHPDFGADVHVGAIADLVLLAGDDVLTAPERPELGFRVARATTYLWPGRAVGASRPARVVRALFLSLFRETTGTPIDEDAPERTSLAVLDRDVREQARNLVQRLLARSPDHNLSLWAQSLGRTADRFGLLVCGDVPVAVRLAASPMGNGDLLDFARSPAFLSLRAALGLTVGATPSKRT
jgi:hypothetical protein